MSHHEHMASAVRGMSWMLINQVASRAVVFLSQLVLGYLLLPRDFGVYALALSVTNAFSAIRNGSTGPMLIQKSVQYEKIISPVTQFALLFNFFALFILLAIAPVANHSFKAAGIGVLTVFIGLSFPLGTLAAVYRTELSAFGRFREVAILNTLSTVLWQIEVIVLALLGFGAYSFAIPMVVQSVLDGVLGWYYVRKWPIHRPLLTWGQFKSLFRETRWIMLGAAMLSLGLTGHYFAAGLFADATTVGVFFFGFQLVMALFVVLNSAIESVLPPIFAALNEDPSRQSQTVISLLATLMVVSLPVAGGLFLSAPTIVNILWSGHWDRSAIVVSLMALSIPAWVIIAVVRALLEARGMWLSRLVLLGVYGGGNFVVVAIAAMTGSVAIIAKFLSGFNCLLATGLLVFLSALTEVPWQQVMRAMLSPVIVTAGCMLTGFLIKSILPVTWPQVVGEFAEIITFGVAALVMNLIIFQSMWRSGLRLLRRKEQGATT